MLVVGMTCLTFASVPLYNLFCRVTGFGGTTQVAADVPEVILDREITVRFNTDVAKGLAWRFVPEQTQLKVKVGEQRLAFFTAENLADKPLTGMAIYNVTPNEVGIYFNKIQCFCFDRQTLAPGEKMQFPVSFFIDPEIVHDKTLDDIRTITLSYTFFNADTSEIP